MLKKIIVGMAAIAMMCMPVAAESVDTSELLQRIEDLEARVAALEAQIGIVPEGVADAQEQEVVEQGDVETGMVANGCTLSFKRAEIGKAYDGKDAVILYFDFTNGSGDTTAAEYEFYIKVYQNDREQENTVLTGNQAFDDQYVELRSGADTVEVAYAAEITDTSDIIVNISSMSDWSVEDVEFSVSLEG